MRLHRGAVSILGASLAVLRDVLGPASAKGTSHMAIDKEGHGTFDIMLIPADR